MISRLDGVTARLTVLAALGVLVGCSMTTTASEHTVNLTSEVLRTDTPAAVVQEPTIAPSATLESTSPAPNTMVIWWPEPLAPLENAGANEMLSEQISGFKAAQGNIEVQLRRKLESGVGGIMSTLRAAGPVAPGALPDLTLMRREDLVAAAGAGLIYPLEGQVSSAILNDLYRAGLTLGQVNSELYGLPYMLDVQHMAYRPLENETPPASFDDILAQHLTLALPGAQTTQIDNLLLTQYLDAGGTLSQTDSLNIDAEAVTTTLNFYEDAVAQGLIDLAVLNYTSPADYQDSLVNGTLDAGLVDSTLYLSLVSAGYSLDYGPVPTRSGAMVGEVDGWMWVLTTSSADRQALAGRFLNWMLNADRQGQYSLAINMIPSQRTALQTWQDTAYIAFVRQILNNALLPFTEGEAGTGVLARAIQNALISVISQDSTAEQATTDLLNRLAS